MGPRMSAHSLLPTLPPVAAQAETPLDAALLGRCRAGDQQAWRTLVAARAAQIYRWAVLLGLGPAEAEDAAQEVFVIAAARLGRCRDEAFGSWLFQITRRVCANHRRRGWWRRWLGLVSLDDVTPAFEGSGANELAVRACLARISPRLAEVLVLMDLEGLTRDEAAAALGLPAGTVASRLRLGREAFERLWNAP
jgi:RNA polymerase sigma-70 factor (ECF subfamily)